MSVWKNSQIAEEYNVFRGTVLRWIKDYKNNNLQLETYKNKNYVIKNEANQTILQLLAEKSKLYARHRKYQKVQASKDLENLLGYTNLIELINNLENHRQIPLKFSYLGQGADIWNETVNSRFENQRYDIGIKNQDFKHSYLYLFDILQKYDTINIVDVGPGNGLITKYLIDILLENKMKLNYYAIDFSKKILEIVKSKMSFWFKNLKIETEKKDIDYDVLQEKLFTNKFNSPNSCNLILFLGGTIGNIFDRHRVLRNFYDSMTKDDYLVITNRLDNLQKRNDFSSTDNKSILNFLKWLPKKLGIKEEFYEIVNKYDTNLKSKMKLLKLKIDLDIEIKIKDKFKIISFFEGEEIILWNHYSYTTDSLIKELQEAKMNLIHLSVSPSKEDVLVITEAM